MINSCLVVGEAGAGEIDLRELGCFGLVAVDGVAAKNVGISSLLCLAVEAGLAALLVLVVGFAIVAGFVMSVSWLLRHEHRVGELVTL